MAELMFTVGFIFLATSLILWSVSWWPYRNLPPGPRPWPIVGNMFTLRKLRFVTLAKKFGTVFTVWMGPKPVIVISGAEHIHDALINQAHVFTNRCDLYSGKALTCNFKTVNTSSGSLWRKLRRNLMSEVLNTSRVKSYKHVRDLEFQNLLEKFRDEAKENDGIVSVMTLVRRTLFNVLLTMCFGERLEESVVTEIDYLMATRFSSFRNRTGNYFPILRPFQWRTARDLKAVMARTDEVLMPYIAKSREAIRKGHSVSGRYVETLIHMQEKEGVDQMTDENIVSLCGEVLNGGTDTTATTLEWVLARLVSNAEVQRKLVEEMATVLDEKPIDESDIDNLPYLQAVVRETQRLDGPVGFALPYAVNQPGVKLAGFNIPMDAQVMFMIRSVTLDAKIWGDPQNFRPERFLEEMAGVDLTGTKNLSFIPFGIGKRICPGFNLALLEVHKMVGMLVQNFEWSSVGPGKLDLTARQDAIAALKTPLRARIRERNISSRETVLIAEYNT